ncbi:FAD binding domain-containing protein [Plastoroseomonas arctica]|uniref:FAD binding domain-containing protein n=1 Tax=Plastoroseomonas arctica TaxID=1509237 RepID=UPI0034628EC0
MSTIWLQPKTLPEALAMLAADPALTPFAGGTDLYPAQAARFAWGEALPEAILDLGALPEFWGIAADATQWRIGAGATWAQLRDAALPAEFDVLRAASCQVGGAQIQNRGTIGGNLCNASPAADGVPPLLALDAAVELASLRGTRTLPLGKFLLGNRQTERAPDELLTAVLVPHRAGDLRSGFEKLGARHYLVISIVMVAAMVRMEAGRIAEAAIAVGACSAVAQRLPALEAALRGSRPGEVAVTPGQLDHLAPIDDARATGAYRREAALVLVRRLLARLALPEALVA